jgi:lipopolysaccharide/colanic/teichoic acid biosynthesis glycosyltransferase
MITIFSLRADKWTVLLLTGDIVIFCATVPLVLSLNSTLAYNSLEFLAWYKTPLLMLLITNLLFLYIADLYDQYQDYRSAETISRLMFTVWAGSILGGLLFSSWRVYLKRGFIEWQALAFCLLIVLWRYAYSALALPERLRRRILIIGAGSAGSQIVEAIRQRPNSGLEAVGFVDDDPKTRDTIIEGVPVLGNSSQLAALIGQFKAELAVIAITDEKSCDLMNNLSRLSFNSVRLIDLPSLYEFLSGKIPLDCISESWLYINSVYHQKVYYRHVKRLLDLGGALLGLAVTLPLLPLIALAIKLDSKGPILFRQPRLGQDGKPFTILKFRTMFEKAGGNGFQWTSTNDPRVTRVGRLLRKLRLDELPQFINILRGEMSLIGPRAEWDIYAKKSQEIKQEWCPGRRAADPPGANVRCVRRESIPFYSFRNVVRPGITGWAQVMFPKAGSSPAELREKLQYDLYYIKNIGFFLDLAILLKSIRVILLGRGK